MKLYEPYRLKFSGLAVFLAFSACASAQIQGWLEPEDWYTRAQERVMADDMREPARAKAALLHDAMRKLWEDHVTWTRLFIVSAAGGLADKAATTDRLLQNQTDIGNAVKPYYGAAAGDALAALLKDHILIAADIVTAAKAGNNDLVESKKVKWFANADDIAAFLSKANPRNWSESELRSMMREHLSMTLEEAVAQLTGDYTGSVRSYDKIHAQILEMADMLTDGLVSQFPDKFRDTGR